MLKAAVYAGAKILNKIVNGKRFFKLIFYQ